MFSTTFSLFLAGVLTIILPCILPLVPIVVGSSIAGRSPWRPALTALGMVIGFVGFTFLLFLFLRRAPELAELIRIATFDILFLFGVGFLFHNRSVRLIGAVIPAVFFISFGWVTALAFAIGNIIAMEAGGWVAPRIQQLGSDVQGATRSEFGSEHPITAFIVGLTLGLVWVPCAGPALAFALTLVREQPGLQAFFSLLAYGLGAALPLLIIGYGGQRAVHSVRALSSWTGVVKKIAGVVLIIMAVALRYDGVQAFQTWLTEATGYGELGTMLEEKLFRPVLDPSMNPDSSSSADKYPKIVRAPELASAGPWHNSEPLTMAGLKGKVVLIDFWTYSCINCIRTLPYIRGYWDKYKDTDKFVIIGVHTPEFVFEQLPENVKMAINKHSLTYPIVQDNDFGTWSAFANRYWPAKYLIDAEGYVRYTHFGEGEYEETDKAIESLLGEIGVTVSDKGQGTSESGLTARDYRGQSPETYIGERSWPAFGSAKGNPNDQIVTYAAPTSLVLNKYYLTGQWQLVDRELQVMHSDTGDIRMKFLGGEINLVFGLEEGAKPVEAEVLIDGKSVKTFTVTEHDLYELFKGDYGEHEMILKLKGEGVEAYAFTFGS